MKCPICGQPMRHIQAESEATLPLDYCEMCGSLHTTLGLYFGERSGPLTLQPAAIGFALANPEATCGKMIALMKETKP